jgi:hypothetical protein
MIFLKQVTNVNTGFLCKIIYDKYNNLYKVIYFKNHESEKEEIICYSHYSAYEKLWELEKMDNHAS